MTTPSSVLLKNGNKWAGAEGVVGAALPGAMLSATGANASLTLPDHLAKRGIYGHDDSGMDPTGVADCGPALSRLFGRAIATGAPLYITKPGRYLLKTAAAATLVASIQVFCHPDAVFVADATLNNKVVAFFNGDTDLFPSFRWHGGQFDVSAQPNSPAGFAYDALTVSENVYGVHIEGVKFYSGLNNTVAGGDSHMFLVGQRIRVINCTFQGAWDTAIYLSGKNSLDFGEDFLLHGCNFKGCIGLVSKRRFKRARVLGNDFSLCPVGASTGDVGGIAANSNGYELIVSNNNFFQCALPISVRLSDGSVVANNIIEDWGTDPSTGLQQSASFAIAVQGSSKCVVVGNTLRQVAWPINNSHRAIGITSRTLQDGSSTVVNSSRNLVGPNVIDGAGVGLYEADANQDANLYISNSVSATTPYSLLGPNSQAFKVAADKSELTSPIVSLGGAFGGAEAVRITSATNNVNYLSISGASTGGFVSLVAAGETNVNLLISSKGTGVMLFGGSSGNETLRLAAAVTGGNAIQINGTAAGSSPVIFSRGVDANSGIVVRGKGTGGGSLQDGGSAKKVEWNTTGLGFFAATPVAKPSISGSRGSNAALASLLTALASYGLVTDGTTA